MCLREVSRVRTRREKGFTLIELLIVVVVIGVLAAVAIPMYQIVPERSKSTESVAGLSLVRRSLRVHYAEHGTYEDAAFVDGGSVTAGGVLDVKDSDLAGRYFSSECYTFRGAPTAVAFVIECDGAASNAPNADEVSTIVVTINEAGDVTREW